MRVLIADDHSLLRDTLAMWLNQNDMETETAGDLPSAIALMESGPFDVVLLDFGMPGMDGLNGLARALASVGNARVALMSGVASRKVVGNALEMGAAGFLPKSLPAKSFVNAVRFIAMGESYVPHDYLMDSGGETALDILAGKITSRELDVLRSLCEGKSNKEIARDLGLQVATVKVHVAALCRKSGAANRTKLAVIAKDWGVF